MTMLSANRRTSLLKPVVNGSVSEGLCLRIPHSAFTLNGFRNWVKSDEFPEKLPVTFVNEEIYLDMSKQEIQTHVLVKGEIWFGVMKLNKEIKRGQFYPDGVLVSNEEAGVSNNPDGVFITWESLERGLVQLVPREGRQGQFMEVLGSPDWALEVVSESSVRKDTKLLRVAYHRAGIREYWLVDARGAEISFQILYWRKSGYVAAPNRAGWQHSRVFERSFRLVREADRLGMFEYTLDIRQE
jgi:Uma2 family endonuclease